MIKGIVFDLDHTLFDRYATLRNVLPYMFGELRAQINPSLTENEFVERMVAADRSDIHRGWRYVVNMLIEQGVFLPGTEAERVLDCLFNRCWPLSAVPFDFTEPTLVKLRGEGYKLGLITNGVHRHQQLKIDMLGIEHLFDEIIICGDIDAQKPDIKPFEEMSRRLGLPAGQLMYVGDNPRNDVDASRRAGYTPVWVRTTGSWIFDDIARALYEVDTVAELPQLVAKLNDTE